MDLHPALPALSFDPFFKCSKKNVLLYTDSIVIFRLKIIISNAIKKIQFLVAWAGFVSASIAIYSIQSAVCCSDQSVRNSILEQQELTHITSLVFLFWYISAVSFRIKKVSVYLLLKFSQHKSMLWQRAVLF